MENKMDDRLISLDILAHQKALDISYSAAADESTNPRLRHEFLTLEREERAWANILANAIHKRGWESSDVGAAIVRHEHEPFSGHTAITRRGDDTKTDHRGSSST